MVQNGATLKGRTVAITRPSGQAEEAAEIIRRQGGKPYFIPTIEIKASTNLEPIEKFIEELARGKVDFVVFMRVNGVPHLRAAAKILQRENELREGLKKTTVLAVGPRTAQELQKYHIRVDLVPEKYTSEGVAQSLLERGVAGKIIRIPRTPAATPALIEKLKARGAAVEQVYVYESARPTDGTVTEQFYQDVAAGNIHAIVFGSSLCVKNLFQMLRKNVSAKNLLELLNAKVTVVAIGPVTAETLAEMGVKVDVMPKTHVFEEALAALAIYWNRIGRGHSKNRLTV